MYLKKIILSLLAVLLCWVAPNAMPSGTVLKKYESNDHLQNPASFYQLLKDDSPAHGLLADLGKEKIQNRRSKFRVPSSSTQLAARVTTGNSPKPFIRISESLQNGGDHLPPPFYYVFLFRLTLF
ncbi:MAG: hypothetical protein ACTHMV_12425 [Chitinophagaceae bacterium]